MTYLSDCQYYLLILLGCFIDRETVRKAKKSKVEVSMSLFKDLLAEQSDKQTASLEDMQGQWLNLEATRMQQEEREREREREQEMKMMQMFGAMINQGNIVKTKCQFM